MTSYAYSPDDWLVSTTRVLGSYIAATINDPDTEVEMSFPDTSRWVKTTPLSKALIHLEQDHIADPVIGFGIPGVEVPTAPPDGTYKFHEAAEHLINYDVGVWVSAEMGGATKRMQLVQALKNIFTTATGKQAFNVATGGLWAVSFDGGRNELDRVNDIPVWRALDMTLIVRVFSRHIPLGTTGLTDKIYQAPSLTIVNADGTVSPVVTP